MKHLLLDINNKNLLLNGQPYYIAEFTMLVSANTRSIPRCSKHREQIVLELRSRKKFGVLKIERRPVWPEHENERLMNGRSQYCMDLNVKLRIAELRKQVGVIMI